MSDERIIAQVFGLLMAALSVFNFALFVEMCAERRKEQQLLDRLMDLLKREGEQ